MEYCDEIILEQIITYKNMNIDDRNMLINLLLHTKDICDSEKQIGRNKSSIFDILFMNFTRLSENKFSFDGTVSGEYENRWISGTIDRKGNKYKVVTHVYRFNDCLDEEEKEYTVIDEFSFKYENDPDLAFRKSRYLDEEAYFEADVELLMDLQLDEYLSNKVRRLKK